MHGIDELRRQYEAAKGKAQVAVEKSREARIRYHVALVEKAVADYAAKGVSVGDKVKFTDGTEAVFDGFKTPRYGDEPEIQLLKIKKDGTASLVKARVSWRAEIIWPESTP